jgi:hypothetical protein
MSHSTTPGPAPSTEAIKLLASVWPGADSHQCHDAFRDLIGGLLRAGMEEPRDE